MFKIIGVDGKEYGPVALDVLRRWLAQGRVNSQTRVRAEGDGGWQTLGTLPEFNVPPPPPPVAAPSPSGGDGLNIIIPYKNPRALVAYYLAIFSLIPFLGIPLGIAAFVLGILGLRFRREHPTARGAVHAWIGIVLGGLCGFGYLALIIVAIVMAGSH